VVCGGWRCCSFFFHSPLFFILFSASSSLFFSVFSLFSLLLLSSLLFVFFSLPSSLSILSHFFSSPPLLQKQGRDMAGVATVLPPLHHPSNTWKVSLWQVGLVGVFLKGSQHLFEGRDDGDRGRKIFFFPCFTHPGEEEDPQCRQNSTVLFPSLFFFSFFRK